MFRDTHYVRSASERSVDSRLVYEYGCLPNRNSRVAVHDIGYLVTQLCVTVHVTECACARMRMMCTVGHHLLIRVRCTVKQPRRQKNDRSPTQSDSGTCSSFFSVQGSVFRRISPVYTVQFNRARDGAEPGLV